MAKVPVYNRQVDPNRLPGTSLPSGTTPDDFGHGFGQAIQRTGEVAGKLMQDARADAQAARRDKATAHLQSEADILLNGQGENSGFKQETLESAQAAYKPTKDQWVSAVAKTREIAGAQDKEDEWNLNIDVQSRTFNRSVDQHLFAQNKALGAVAEDAVKKEAIKSVEKNPSRQNLSDQAYLTSRALRQRLERDGVPEKAADKAVQERYGEIVNTAIWANIQ